MPKDSKKKLKHTIKKKHRHRDNHDNEHDDDNKNNEDNEDNEDSEDKQQKIEFMEKTRARMKHKIQVWMDNDDKIKDLNVRIKKYKDNKKEQEELIIDMITKLGMEENKIDVQDKDGEIRGRVYRHKSITKGTIKENIIKDALMEIIRDEKKVNQLVKKIDSKRPINERYYLKRTKGNNKK